MPSVSHSSNRRGELSGLGKTEHRGLGLRTASRLVPLFTKILANESSRRIAVVSSGKSRTIASLQAFIEGLPSAVAASSIDYEPADPALLYFHDNIQYQLYTKKDKQLKNKLRSIQMQPASKLTARNVLERLYQRSFVEKLANGDYSLADPVSGKSIKDEVDAVRMLHGLYLIGSNLREEGAGSLLEDYFRPDESAWFAYLFDAKVRIRPSESFRYDCLLLFHLGLLRERSGICQSNRELRHSSNLTGRLFSPCRAMLASGFKPFPPSTICTRGNDHTIRCPTTNSSSERCIHTAERNLHVREQRLAR